MEAIDGAVGVSAEEVLARGGVEGSRELVYGGGLAGGGFEGSVEPAYGEGKEGGGDADVWCHP